MKALLAALLLLAAGEYPVDTVGDPVAPSSAAPFTGGTVTNATTFSQGITANGNNVIQNANITGSAAFAQGITANGNSTLQNVNVTGGINTSAPLQTNGTIVANLHSGGIVPAAINPNAYYAADEFDRVTTSYSVAGTNGPNYNIAIPNSVSASIFGTGNLGGAYVGTSSTSQGGYVVAAMSLNIVKSSTITYQWRQLFYVGTLSDATNPYTLTVGGMVVGSASTGSAPFTGPYLSYTHGTNSGQWVMGSATASTQITANSSVAVTTGWHKSTFTLSNGTYTYVLDGTTLGTVNDTNMATTATNNQGASLGGIMIVPNAAWTTARYAAIDRADIYITGLNR